MDTVIASDMRYNYEDLVCQQPYFSCRPILKFYLVVLKPKQVTFPVFKTVFIVY